MAPKRPLVFLHYHYSSVNKAQKLFIDEQLIFIERVSDDEDDDDYNVFVYLYINV